MRDYYGGRVVIDIQVWMGVAFLLLMGVLGAYESVQHARGQYIAEAHREYASSVRWCWAIIYAVISGIFFFMAIRLIRFIMTR